MSIVESVGTGLITSAITRAGLWAITLGRSRQSLRGGIDSRALCLQDWWSCYPSYAVTPTESNDPLLGVIEQVRFARTSLGGLKISNYNSSIAEPYEGLFAVQEDRIVGKWRVVRSVGTESGYAVLFDLLNGRYLGGVFTGRREGGATVLVPWALAKNRDELPDAMDKLNLLIVAAPRQPSPK